jgi:hypothetical protein
LRVAANKKPPGSGGHEIVDSLLNHMTKGRRRLEPGTISRPARAHVQNSAFAVSVAVLRITINGAPLFDRAIMPDRATGRQGIYRSLSERPAGPGEKLGDVEYEPMFRFIFKLLRLVLVCVLGAAVAAKLLLESNAEPTTEEIDLVSIFEGQHLASEAAPFYGGKVMSMFGGVLLDLRKATPAPTGIYLDLAVVMGGVSLVVPEGWRVKFEGNLMAGGFSDETRTTADADQPTVTLTGFVLMGGVQATTRSPARSAA